MEACLWAEKVGKELPSVLQALRENRGISKNELAVRTGLARSFITYLEQGRANPSAESLARLGYALGLSPGDILKRAEKKTGQPIPRFKMKSYGRANRVLEE